MASVLAIVSKAVFERDARLSGGALAKVGDVLPLDSYASAHKGLAPLASGGALFLVTVRPPELMDLIVTAPGDDAPRFVEAAAEGGGDGVEITPEARVLRLAPREVPRALVLRLLFGVSNGVWAWPLAVISMALVLMFVPCTDLGLAEYDRQVSATVTSTESTNTSEGDRRKIHRVHYTFVDESGVERRGEAYTTDPPALGSWPVDYQSSDPSSSRLHGMRSRHSRAPGSAF